MFHKPGEQRHARPSLVLCVVAFLAVAAGCSDSRSGTASAELRAPGSGAESDGLVIRFYRDDGTEEAKFYRSDYRSIASTGAAFPRHPVMLVVFPLIPEPRPRRVIPDTASTITPRRCTRTPPHARSRCAESAWHVVRIRS